MNRSKNILRLSCFLIFVALANSTYTPCDDCTGRANTTELSKIELRLYSGETVDTYTTVLVGNASYLLGEIDSSKPTVLYIFGWTETPDSESVQTILNAYLGRQDHNILLVDYSEIAGQAWDYASASADGVGYTLATAFDELVAEGFESSTLHVVGHSLGAQVAGFLGRYANFELPRITGLDPAGPSFSESEEHLSSSDAKFVDLIHTDAGVFGISYSSGTVDFYPNGGSSPQPGCENDMAIMASACSHSRSWAYYAESLTDEDAFSAIACDSYTLFKAGSCSSGATVYMGYATPTTASGDFDLQTNSASPYGREEEGITYTE